MGIGGISIWQILIVLLVVLVLFGEKKLELWVQTLEKGLKVLKKQSKMRILNQLQKLIQKINSIVSNGAFRNSSHLVGWNLSNWTRAIT